MTQQSTGKHTGLEIAVIGMSGRFPGARNIEEFWNNLKTGRETISFFSDEELERVGTDVNLINDTDYVKAMPVLEDKDCFDAYFFGYSPAEAEIMAPQMRIFYECTWSALEDAGYDPMEYEGLIGCYVGASSSFGWEALSVLSGKHQNLGTWETILLSGKDNLGTRLAYKLDFKGPAYTFFTACSTSLVAVHFGCRALLTGECTMALAGGVSVVISEKSGYVYREGMIHSPDGHCRTFDGKANGTIFGEGVGVVVLKRYRDAVADEDHIYALVKGTAINNDGIDKAGYTTPGMRGQRDVIQIAQRVAKVSADSIIYVETHGTGTALGDPVETEALKHAFNTGNTGKKPGCALGCVKTNVGHLDIAAGIAGFIKTVLALYHRLIPPNLHFETLNPKIDLKNTRFYVNTRLTPWPNEIYPLRAGVSSFGIGGTNAHVVLEEYSEGTGGLAPLPDAQSSRQYQLILLSAKTETALEKMTEKLAAYFKRNPGIHLSDAAFTLQKGRRVFPYRRMLTCSTTAEAIDGLLHSDNGNAITYCARDENHQPPVIFMFPGLGSEYVNMGRELYEKEPIFREELDRCFEVLESIAAYNLKETIYPSSRHNRSDGSNRSYISDIHQTEIAQIAIFIFEYALAKLLLHWGIKPRAMIGYSFGEYAAACVSGVFSLQDALKVVVARGELLQKVSAGVMVSVPLSRQELTPMLESDRESGLSLAIDNGPSCIVAGTPGTVDSFEKRMKAKKILCLRVPVSRAIHSRMMEPILKEFREIVGSSALQAPQIPYVSNVTGNWISAELVTDPGYWSTHMRQTVCFADGIKMLLNKVDKKKNALFIEVGPGRDLSALVVRYIENNPELRVINLIRHPQKNVSDVYFLLNKIGRLWLYGKTPCWDGFYSHEKRQRIPLPTYSFDAHRYWLEGDLSKLDVEQLQQQTSSEKKPDIADWFYIPSWKRSLSPAPAVIRPRSCWLLFVDTCGLGSLLAKALEQHEVIIVKKGQGYSKQSEGDYTINPGLGADYHTLLAELEQAGKVPGKIIHLWNVTNSDGETSGRQAVDNAQEYGLYSLFHLVKAIGNLDYSGDFKIFVISDNIHYVSGSEIPCPEKSTLMAAVKVIPQEYPFIICRSIDIEMSEPGTWQEERIVHRLLAEFSVNSSDTVIAFRDDFRWVQTFEPVRLETIPGDMSIPRLRQEGVYLITGGLGGIGFTVAEYLAGAVRARLVLTGRSPFPARNQWDEWLAHHNENDRVSRRICQIKKLEELGAKVLVFSVDVALREKMHQVITRAEEQFGPLNGVIHAAGILGDGTFDLIQQLGESQCKQQFHAKVYGLMVLEEVLENRELDFCLLTSSLSPVLGGLGLAAYAAANQFMDAFVYRHNRQHPGRWTSLNWGDWQSWEENEPDREIIIGASLSKLNMTPEQGIETFRRILAYCDASQVIVSAGDLQARINQWVKLEALREEETGREKQASFRRRPQLTGPYIPPGSPVEQTLAQIWQRLFGFDKVGVQDDFFELGGDSLKVMTTAAKIHKALNIEIPLMEFFNRTTIRKLAEYININASGKSTYAPIQSVEKREYYPLTPAQKRLYILQQLEKDFIGYNETSTILLAGEPDRQELEKAFKEMIQRQESLRTSFFIQENEPVQKIHDEVEFEIEYYQVEVKVKVEEGEGTRGLAPLSLEPAARSQQPVISTIRNFNRSFDLSQAPLLRVGLIKAGNKKYILVVDMHHIIADGTSQLVLADEFKRLYEKKELPSLRLQYKDYAQWQNSRRQQEVIKQQEGYWLACFSTGGELPVLNLPVDFPRPVMQSFVGSAVHFECNEQETRNIKEILAESGATLYMFLLSVFNILLSKLSGLEDIIVGTPVAARRHADLQHIIGMFANTLVMRNTPSGNKTVNQFLKEVKENTLNAYENQEYPFEELVDRLSVQRDTSRNPIFDVMFNLLNQADCPHDEKDHDNRPATAKFDLNLSAVEMEKHLSFELEYCTKLFKENTIHRIITYFKKVIRSISANREQYLSDIEIITNEEKRVLLLNFNDTAADFPYDKTIHRLFEEKVNQFPLQIALIFEDHQLTYRELNKRANQLARLLKAKGTGLDEVLGLLVKRSLEMVVGMLGIMKAGGAYLPIDPQYPAERTAYMLKDSTVKRLLTNVDEQEKIVSNDIEMIDLGNKQIYTGNHRNPGHMNQSSHLVYLIYTSGSTGKPKGVMLKHSNLVNLLIYGFEFTNLDFSVVLQFSTISFDVSFQEIFSALLWGGKLCLIHEEIRTNIPALFNVIQRSEIKTVFFPMALLKLIFNEESYIEMFPGCVRHIQTAGEQVVVNDAFRNYLQVNHIYLHNHYGPSETHVVTALTLDPTEHIPELPFIGKPIANTQIFILDKYENLQPVGVSGELSVAGIALGRGYLNRPELTVEKFCLRRPGGALFEKTAPVKHLDSPRKNFLLKMTGKNHRFHRSYRSHMSYITYLSYFYKTGDLARWLSDGNIEFLGRLDHQVKIRGFRVEPGEIEVLLLNHTAVQEAVVLVKGEKEKFLCAYIITIKGESQEKTPGISALREYLSGKLPDYMIPSYFVFMDTIPLTSSGKIDRKGLPEPGYTPGKNYTAPRDEIDSKLVDIWREIFPEDVLQAPIGIEDNFFELGGHSLKAAVMAAKIHKAFGVKLLLGEVFKSPYISKLSKTIKQLTADEYISIEPVEKKEYYPQSSAQARLFIIEQMGLDATVYNLPISMMLEGDIQVERLEETFKKLIKRHESLRTSFAIIGSRPVQRIHDQATFKLEYYCAEPKTQNTGDSPQRTESGSDTYLSSVIRLQSSEFVRPFDLSRGPLFRVRLNKIRDNKFILMVDMHHIISDGVSISILISEFGTLYCGKCLPELRIHYKDFSRWQGSNIEKENQFILKQEFFWLEEFRDEVPVLELPMDFNRPAHQDFEGADIAFRFDQEETRSLHRLALNHGATLFMVLLAVFNVLLSKMSNQEDIVVGTPIAGRRHPDMERIIGVFVNVLALRNFPSGDKSFTGFLKELREHTLAAYENQEYQFEDLVDRVQVNRDASRNPIFDVALVLQNIETAGTALETPELLIKPVELHTDTSKFDLSIVAAEVPEQGFYLSVEYCTRLFRPETIQRFIQYFKRITKEVMDQPDQKISQIDILSEQEKQQLLVDFNDTRAGYPEKKTLHRLFAEQVEKTPDNAAVVGPMQIKNRIYMTHLTYISYRELNESSDQLAHRLTGKGVQVDTMVGIMVERSVEMIIGILGILKAGAAYVPIDPDYPEERIDYMLSDSNAGMLLTHKDIATFPSTLTSTCQVSPTNLAYIIYTSGTTGKSKGSLIEHRNVVQLLFNDRFGFDFGDTDIWTLFHSFCFDFSVWEMYGALLYGGQLLIIPKTVARDSSVFLDVLKAKQVSVLNQTPGAFYNLINEELKHKNKRLNLKYVIFGGEALKPLKLKPWKEKYPNTKLINMFGITETTVHVTFKEITDKEIEQNMSNIGKPIPTLHTYIVDKYLRLQPIGVPGELCVGGDGVCRGYLNRPELTSEKFDHDLWDYRDYHDEKKNYKLQNTNYKQITNYKVQITKKTAHELHEKNNEKLLRGVQGGGFLEKSPPGRRRQKLYKSGDLVRVLPDGEMEYLGRIDQQVKIRGYRIELGEIENHLLIHPAVKEAVVIAKEEKESGDRYICAYWVPDQGLDMEEQGEETYAPVLRKFLSNALPDYMVPAFFVKIQHIPLTPNGKVDRKQLPDAKTGSSTREYLAPENEMERKLVQIWTEVLGRADIGIDDNFFEIGGHSLKATIMISMIQKTFNIKIPLVEIFTSPSIRGLAEILQHQRPTCFFSLENVEKKEYYNLSSAQMRLYILQQLDKDSVRYNVPHLVELQGEIDMQRLNESFRQLITRHESLRTSFENVEEIPVQRIHHPNRVDFKIHYQAMADSTVSTLVPLFQELMDDFIQPIDFSAPPLLRVQLLKTGTNTHLLMMDLHHIITDGTSIGVLIKDFMDLYSGRELPPLKLQYKDFSQWQNKKEFKRQLKEQETFWLNQFTGEPPQLNLPFDSPRPKTQSFKGKTLTLAMGVEETRELNQLALAEEATLFMVMLALFNILLFKINNIDKKSDNSGIVVGIASAGRQAAPELQSVIGMFINTLALKNHPREDQTFREFLQEVKQHTLTAFENQDYQFEELVDRLGLSRDTGRNPLFDVMFALQNQETPRIEIPGLTLKTCDFEINVSYFDLSLNAIEAEDSLFLNFFYNIDLFKQSTVERFITYFKEIVSFIITDKTLQIKDINISHQLLMPDGTILAEDDEEFGF